MRTGKKPQNARRLNLFALGVFIIMAAIVAVPLYSARSSSSPSRSSSRSKNSNRVTDLKASNSKIPNLSLPAALQAAPSPTPLSVATYDATCTTLKSDFNLGDTVCVKATGVPNSLFPWRVSWVDPSGVVNQLDPASTDDTTQYTYMIPASSTTVLNEQTYDNRGTWTVNLTRPNGAVRLTARFIVHEPAQPRADVFVQKFRRDSSDQIHAGENIAFIVIVGNKGPDAAVNVHLADSTPAGATLSSFTRSIGPVCTPVEAGVDNDCVIASMANGDVAEYTAIYNLGSNTPGSYQASATASGSASNGTTTASYPDSDPDTSNNSFTAGFDIQTGTSTTSCDLTCPTSIEVSANTTEGGVRGAHVNFDAAEGTGTCGTINAMPASGSFFPVGTTVVTVTSETGGGSCSFSVTVDDASGNVSISCPGNLQGTANGDCEATFNLGNPTTTGDNVTISVSRSDGKPMYNCDVNGDNCVRKTADLPFASGTTTVTWTAFSHDTAGPYASAEDEEAHRTGNDSCNQIIIVRDVTPPVITAVSQTISADASCQAVVPDYSNAVTDNCSCAASDGSQDCVNQHRISVTQDVAAGTVLGLGAHTIHLTANDGASDPGPDGIPETADDGTGNITNKTITLTVVDTTAPVFTGAPLPTVTAYTGSGATSCDAVVSLATPATTDNCSAVTITRSPSGDTFPVGNTTVTWTATDAAGNHSSTDQTVTVIDNTPPIISCPSNITVYLPLHTTATSMAVSYPPATATDNCPGTTIGYSIASGSTFSVGATPVTATATDAHGNSASCTFTITVLYDFTGFFSPVNNTPTVNVVNAGRAIPVKFSLSGNKGLNIFAVDSPQSGVIPCDASAPAADLTDTVTAGGSSLSYDAGSDQYIYVWKTDSSWAGTCRQLVVTLNDGSVHVANFKFR